MSINSIVQNRIVSLLRWDDDRYSRFLFESGNAYLYAYIKGEAEEVIAQIKRSRSFWNWWKLHWEKRDIAFLDSAESVDWRLARQLYQNLHDAATLAGEIYPNGEVLGESYAKMIGELNKEVCHVD